MSEPWKAEPLNTGRFRFTNTSGHKLAMIVLLPIDDTEVEVEDGAPGDPYVVPAPVDPDGSFIAVVRGAGVSINATALPSRHPVYWTLEVS